MTHLIFVIMGDGAWQTTQEDVWNSEPLSRQPLAWGTAVSPDQEHWWVQMPLLVCEQRQQQPELWGGSWGHGVDHGALEWFMGWFMGSSFIPVTCWNC